MSVCPVLMEFSIQSYRPPQAHLIKQLKLVCGVGKNISPLHPVKSAYLSSGTRQIVKHLHREILLYFGAKCVCVCVRTCTPVSGCLCLFTAPHPDRPPSLAITVPATRMFNHRGSDMLASCSHIRAHVYQFLQPVKRHARTPAGSCPRHPAGPRARGQHIWRGCSHIWRCSPDLLASPSLLSICSF